MIQDDEVSEVTQYSNSTKASQEWKKVRSVQDTQHRKIAELESRLTANGIGLSNSEELGLDGSSQKSGEESGENQQPMQSEEDDQDNPDDEGGEDDQDNFRKKVRYKIFHRKKNVLKSQWVKLSEVLEWSSWVKFLSEVECSWVKSSWVSFLHGMDAFNEKISHVLYFKLSMNQ